ncbi:MAG: hypothetical protein KJ000_31515 [Pirellulaceae bacterium]|nr:hypothetical protein [Pirellulaceae bacterium]
MILACFLVGLLAYLAVFFGADADRAEALLAAFIPDQVLWAWIGGDPSRIGLADRLFVAFFAGVILVLAGIIGHLPLSLVIGRGGLSRLETTVFSIAVGLSGLSLLTLLFGLAGGLQYPIVFWGVLLAFAGGAVARRTLARASVADSQGESPLPNEERGRLELSHFLLAVPFLVLIVLGGMMPPWEFDVREYHLQVPKEWFQAGRIQFLPHNVYGNMPLGAELHAVLGMVLVAGWADWWWGALVGKTVMAGFAPLTALGLLAAVRRHVSATAGWAAALIYLSVPWVVQVSITGLNEGAVACYALLAVAAMMIYQQETASESPRASAGYLLLAGFLAGSSAACKYPALLFVVLPLAVWSGWATRAPRWKAPALFLLAALLAVGPWYAKNAAFTGNSFYPLVFGGATRTPELMEQWNRAHRVPPDDLGRRYTLEQAGGSFASIAWRSRWISPLVLPLVVLAWWSDRHRRQVLQLSALIAWTLAVWWLATHRVDRFLLPALPWAAWLAGIAVVWSNWRPWRATAMAILVAGVVFNFLILISSGEYDRRLLVSLTELRIDEPAESGGPSRVSSVHRYLNATVPAGKQALLVGDAQPFDLEVPALYHTCFDPCIFEQWMRDRDAEQRREILEEHRISHVYFDWSEIARYRSPGNYGFRDWVTRDLVWEELVRQQGILRPVPLDMEAGQGELFEVIEAAAN